MDKVVFDSSALLALILDEPGGDLESVLDRAMISAVNLTEVRTKLIDLGPLDADSLDEDLRGLIHVEPFTEAQAIIAAQLREATRHFGLSLGDRACMALGIFLNVEVYTSDNNWSRAECNCKVRQIR